MFPDQPAVETHQETGERIVAGLAIFMVLGIAVFEVLLIVPDIGRHVDSSFSYWMLNAQAVMLPCVWLSFLAQERVRHFEHDVARAYRKAGWFVQAVLVLMVALAHWGSLWPPLLAVAIVLMGVTVWHLYIQHLALEPEDQVVLDEIIRNDRMRKRERWERERDIRRSARLAQIAALYGHELADGIGQPVEPVRPSVSWEIPEKAHAPLVYFMRNGNRIKIGTTTNLRSRIRSLALRKENVVLLEVGGRSLEREFHQRFGQYRDGNTEWFREVGELAEYLSDRIEQIRIDLRAAGEAGPEGPGSYFPPQ
ncbi:GIY-YIG nuclease family protein [Streptomyces lonarensis]|uniref:GIY-YIG nuclease family protein n=1 Tax=Streptomyces lonarensis TaxID=700599 RepID=A0A7X6CWV1_9ACTN|nr:GIY-YIG nuclease family protein [Streptomyces lonarensis]NJQ04057.1 GIY-YIG nuclease family protein [Streptomyces lonarensis]